MPASMTIDQAGLPAGVPNFARTDGLATGALVTLESVGGGFSHRFELLWVPPADTTAAASLAPTGPTTWTFSPQALTYGSYRILLVVDEGTATESRQILTLVVRTPGLGLIIPAANERADPNATIGNAGGTTIFASEQNEPFAPFVLGSSWGWWRSLAEAILAVDAVAAGGGKQAQRIIVGNALAGDTLAICDFLDPGDGSGFEAALAAAGALPAPGGDVAIRAGNYGPGLAPPFVIPTGTTVRGAGSKNVVITGSSTVRQAFTVSPGAFLSGVNVVVPMGTPGAMSNAQVIDATFGSLDDVLVDGSAIDPAELTETLTALVLHAGSTFTSLVDVLLTGVLRLDAGNPTALVGLSIPFGNNSTITGLSVEDCDTGATITGTGYKVANGQILGAVNIGIELNGCEECSISGMSVAIDSTTWGNPCWGIVVDGNSARNSITGNAVVQEGIGLALELVSSGLAGTGNNTVTGNTLKGDALNLAQVQLGATEAGSVVIGNTVPGGVISDLGTFNEVAHNPTYLIP